MTIFDEYITIGEVSRKNVDGDFILVEHRCCALVEIYIEGKKDVQGKERREKLIIIGIKKMSQ